MSKISSFQHIIKIKIVEVFYRAFLHCFQNQCIFYTYRTFQLGLAIFQLLDNLMWTVVLYFTDFLNIIQKILKSQSVFIPGK